MTKDLTQGNPAKLILGFAGPLLIGMLFQQLYSMVDTIIVGKCLGTEALAAVGSTGSVNFLIVGFGMGICSGFAIPVANKFGARDYIGLRKTVANSAILSIIISITLAIVTVILCKPILSVMRTPDNILDSAYSYIVIIFAGIPAIFLYNMTSGIIRSIGDSKTPVYFLLMSSVINIGLDLLFIAGFGMGVEGAAIATVVAQLIAGLSCLLYMNRKYELLRIRKSEWKLEGQIVKNLCGMGVPMGLQYSITAIGCVILQAAVNDLGSDAVAAITAGSKISMFLVCPFDALGATMATYGGQNVGAKKLERLTPGLITASISGFIYAGIAFFIISAFGENLLLLFLDATETAIIENAQLYLLINASCYVFLVIVNVVRFLIQGMGFGIFAIGAGIFEMVARTAGAFLLVPILGFAGASMGNPIAWIFADIFLIPAYIYARRKLYKIMGN
ncbi:MAG: MATE family efflux transporter [Lachnospiraceae bacterium]